MKRYSVTPTNATTDGFQRRTFRRSATRQTVVVEDANALRDEVRIEE